MSYTYIYMREDGLPYYVGKGNGGRAFTNKGKPCNRPVDANRILIQEFPSDGDALAAERFLISYYGRKDLGLGPLLNRSDGGEGPSGTIVTAEHRRKLSAWVRTPEMRAKMRQSHLGEKQKPERVAARLSKVRGKKRDLETRLRMREIALKRYSGKKSNLCACGCGRECPLSRRPSRTGIGTNATISKTIRFAIGCTPVHPRDSETGRYL